MENYHAPKFKVQSSSNVENQEKAKCKTGLKKKNIMRSVKHGEKNYLVQTANVEVELLFLAYTTLLFSTPPPSPLHPNRP